jgi:hypothetical protein
MCQAFASKFKGQHNAMHGACGAGVDVCAWGWGERGQGSHRRITCVGAGRVEMERRKRVRATCEGAGSASCPKAL